MLKQLRVGVLILLGGTLCVGQQTVAVDEQLNRRRVEAVMGSLRDQIKALDEPALRVFLRLRAAKFLWTEKSDAASRAAEAMASEALIDIQEHTDEIPSLYVKLFRREALAALQLHTPAAAARLIKKYDLESTGNGFDTAYELLGQKEGISKAVELMQRSIRSGGELSDSNLNFFLSRLDETQPTETTRLLADIITAAERTPGNYPVEFLFGVANKYVYRNATPADLQARFLTLFIRATANPAALPPTQQTLAYNLLKANLPLIERLLPALYAQANAQMAALAPSLPKQTSESENAQNNIKSSSDPLDQMITEAEAAKDESLKRSLLAEAAQKALDKDKLKLAVDLIMKIKPQDKTDEENFISYRDQFLGDVVRKAISKKEYDALAYAAANIRDPLQHSSALQRLALAFYEAQDLGRAREIVDEAYKLIESANDDARKAASLLNLATFFLKIDELRVLPTTQASIKIINSLPSPKQEEKAGGELRRQYVQTLLQISYNLVPVFQRLAQKDEAGTLALANRLQRPELKAAAILGASMGIPAVSVQASSTVKAN
jgi:hypothetical protein